MQQRAELGQERDRAPSACPASAVCLHADVVELGAAAHHGALHPHRGGGAVGVEVDRPQ